MSDFTCPHVAIALAERLNNTGWYLNADGELYRLIADCWAFPELKLEILHRIADWDEERRALFRECVESRIQPTEARANSEITKVLLSSEYKKFLYECFDIDPSGSVRSGEVWNLFTNWPHPSDTRIDANAIIAYPLDSYLAAMFNTTYYEGSPIYHGLRPKESIQDLSDPTHDPEAGLTEEVFYRKDTVKSFYEEFYTLEYKLESIYNADAYRDYLGWCAGKDIDPCSKPYFREKMSELVPSVMRDGNQILYMGISRREPGGASCV